MDIFLIHGAFSTRSSWSVHEKEIEKFGNIHYFEYDIQDEAMESIISRCAIETSNAKDVVLIGHSFGGVIASVLAGSISHSGKACKVITLSSPLGGIKLPTIARFFNPFSTFYSNVSHTSPFFRNLRTHGLAVPTYGIITMAGNMPLINEPNDGVVTISSQLAFVDDHNFNFSPVQMNHFEVLMSSDVTNLITRRLV